MKKKKLLKFVFFKQSMIANKLQVNSDKKFGVIVRHELKCRD